MMMLMFVDTSYAHAEVCGTYMMEHVQAYNFCPLGMCFNYKCHNLMFISVLEGKAVPRHTMCGCGQ